MWNFIKGVQLPKRKLSADHKVAHKHRYDACERKREFRQHWLKQFCWLEYTSLSAGTGFAAHAGSDQRDDDAVVDVEGGESDGTAKITETELSMRMFCKYCCKYEKAGSFVVGSPVFKLESIKAHNSSASHMKWALRESREQPRVKCGGQDDGPTGKSDI